MSFLEHLRSPEPLLAVELRPPRADLEHGDSMDSWFEMESSARRLSERETVLFLTDSAVGVHEEENLHHMITNFEADVSRELICPFLTTKHSLEYCMWFAARAVEAGCEALTVLGGDRSVGAPRCVPHGYVLRQHIRERYPTLALGGWANPFREPERQIDHLLDPAFTADFYLTQIVSHFDLPAVEKFCSEAERRGVTVPGVFGVFYYRSARRKTLARLKPFFRVPEDEVVRAFDEEGLSADELCARTIRRLRDAGVKKVYVSNFRPGDAPRRLDDVGRLV